MKKARDIYDILFENAKDYIERKVLNCHVDVTILADYATTNKWKRSPIKVKLTPISGNEYKPEWSVVFLINIELLRANDDKAEMINYYLNEATHVIAKSAYLEPDDITYSF